MNKNIFRFLLSAVLMMCCTAVWAGGDWTILEQPTCSKYGTMQNPANTSELRLVPKLAHHFGDDGKCTVCHQPAPTKYSGTPATSLVTITESNYAAYGLTEKNKGCVMGWTVITTAEEFMKYMNSRYYWIEFNAFLAEDIILNDTENLPEQRLEEGYVFDGTGHTISNMYRSGEMKVGLFEDNNGTIRNLGLIAPHIVVSKYYGGCICGYNSGLIENCFVIDGNIDGENNVYGIAAQILGGQIINCYAISNKGNIGRTDSGTVTNSYGATTGRVPVDFYASTLNGLNANKANGISWSINPHFEYLYLVMMPSMIHHPATVTCTDGGYGEYWYCTVCEKYFLDANHTQATTLEHLKLSALGHDMKYFDRVEATCVATGNIAHFHCDRCGKNFEDKDGAKEIDIVIPINPQNHPSELQHFDEIEATCTTNGNIKHYHCDRCLKNFEDEAGTNEIDNVVIAINPQNHPSKLQYFDEIEATCTTNGNIEHYHCDRCLKNFEDEAGTTEIINVVIPINPNNHNLSLEDGKAHCDRCNQDISGFISINNDTPILLTKYNDEYFLKADFVLDGGVNYLAGVDFIVNGTFTYHRNVSGVQKGAWQCWYEPFELELTEYVLEKMDVAEVAGVLIDNEGNTVVAFRKIDSGWMKANTPYVFRPKDAILTTESMELKTTSPKLRKSEETTFYNMSTYDKFTFGGNYTARHNDSWYTLNTSGQFQRMKEGVNLKGQRFWMTIEARDDIPYEYGGIVDAKGPVNFTVLGDDEPTGIESLTPTSHEGKGVIYNLNGQKVTSIQKGQVYIMNGKKYIAR